MSVLNTGESWTLLLPADNMDMMVNMDVMVGQEIIIIGFAAIILLYSGGYTESTRSSYSLLLKGITVDPVEYHCKGQENNLQDCNRRALPRCSAGVTIVCVYRNSSGMQKQRTQNGSCCVFAISFRSMQLWGHSSVGWGDRI